MTSYVQDKLLTIALSGEIDHHRARLVLKTVSDKIDEYLPKICVLDFRDVTFMDSSGIAIVIYAVRRVRELGGTLRLQNIPAQAEKVLRAAGIEKIAEIKGGSLHETF